ncbi:MAG: 16S rRNA processing protein RimM [Clostridia bacterium]|nr:16S rRNA processing protein RimM [Clostridia bacterium]
MHVGRILAPHGVRGEMKIEPLTEDPSRFDGLEKCLLVAPDEKERREARILSIRPFGGYLLVAVEGIGTREEARAAAGWFLSVPREDAIPLPPGRYFIFDLIGCGVFEDGQRLGTLRDVLQTGANDVYVVARDGRRDLLVPVIEPVVQCVDIEARRIDVRLPEGLSDIYD